MSNKQKISFIGFGEVGQRFTRDLLKRDDVEIFAYDIKFNDPQNALTLQFVQEKGVTPCLTLAQAVGSSSLIISAITAGQTFLAAKEAAQYMTKGQVFFDINSASPVTKLEASHLFNGQYVEGAVMASVDEPGINVNILMGGEVAQKLSKNLNALGFNTRAIAKEIGIASATKLSRSIVMKGIEALMLDSMRVAKHWGVEKDVFDSLTATYKNADWAILAPLIEQRVARHGLRRSEEMFEAANMVRDAGFNHELVREIAKAHAAYVREKNL